jgi:hypothetical protein
MVSIGGSNMESEHSINYDGPALFELDISGTQYRLDAGKQGTALSVSSRRSGTWQWEFLGEAHWRVGELRTRALERSIVEQLSAGLKRVIADLEDQPGSGAM